MSVSAFKEGALMSYLAFLTLLAGLGSAFAFGGRPLSRTLLIFLKSSSVYKASCEKGLHPARCNRLLTVSCGSLSLPAISEIVMPFMPYIIGILAVFLDIVHFYEHLLNSCVVEIEKKLKIVHKKGCFILTYCSFI
jgi:hypothetical protein